MVDDGSTELSGGSLGLGNWVRDVESGGSVMKSKEMGKSWKSR
jgi:hypothetical protein